MGHSVLFIRSDSITLLGIAYALHLLGHEVIETDYRPHLNGCDESEIDQIRAIIKENAHVDFVVSYDFVPAISEACEREHVYYLAYVYDCPLTELYRREAGNHYSVISVFDKEQYEYLRARGRIRNLLYSPLGADVEALSAANIEKEEEGYYTAEISFVGRLYQRQYIDTIWKRLEPWAVKEIDLITENAIGKWGKEPLLYGLCSEELVHHVYELFGEAVSGFDIDPRYFVETSFLAPICNSRERAQGLNRLTMHHKVTLYSDEKKNPNIGSGIECRKAVDYWCEMPKVFYMSKINLNISSASILSGIPQRVWDIMACGGFCLTNSQPEIEEYLEPGKDVVVYRDFDEMEKLADYYLEHEEERLRIAINGYRKVKMIGDMKFRMESMIRQMAIIQEDKG